MFGFSKKKVNELKATQTGELVDIATLPDPVFAEKMLGDGFAIKPSDDKIYSPASGTVIEVQDSLHAYGIETPDGLQLLIHIGINTVELNGEGFTTSIKKGDKIYQTPKGIYMGKVSDVRWESATEVVESTETGEYIKTEGLIIVCMIK